MNSKSTKIKSKSISILLGAGFSAPQGYPVGKEMNCKLLNFDNNNVSFSLSGELGTYTDERKENHNNEMYKSYYRYFIFCKRLIKEYNNKKKFDYEEFYDFIRSDKVKEKHYRDLFDLVFHYDESSKSEFEQQCVSNLTLIYNQMVEYLLKDKNGKNNYDDEPFKDSVDGYDGFLKYLSQLIKSDYTINVHTLNHDLLFESFNNTKYINNCISDGFDKYGSKYYGQFNNRTYLCLLKRYTGIYNTPIHLFKLHGSIDYLPYRDRLNGTIDNYVKMERGMDKEIFKMRKVKKGYDFDSDPFEYHPDFLTGITKIESYETPPLFDKLFKRFKENLKVAEKLIIIGYGCKDSGINKIIKEHFNYQHKPSFIVDKCAGEDVQKLGKEINASIHKIDVDLINSDLF